MSYPIATIEGIGPVYADKLKKAGIRTTAALLARAKDPKGRKEVAAAADIDDGLILKWANMADLMRIKGVGEEYSELLEAAGVDSVVTHAAGSVKEGPTCAMADAAILRHAGHYVAPAWEHVRAR